jgi:type IV pilus assembly protein PilA
MPRHRRPGLQLADVRAFSIVELLVCMLIIAIMAAIALPAFLDQRAKGEDAEAKLALSTAVIALDTYAVTESTYDATREELEAIEPALAEARNLRVDGTAVGFELREDSAGGREFTLARSAAGSVTRDCSSHGYGLCRASPDPNGNRW